MFLSTLYIQHSLCCCDVDTHANPSLYKSKNTTITTAMLTAVGRAVEATEPQIMSALGVANPITKSLFCNKDYESHDIELLLKQLRETGLHLRAAGAVS